MPAHRDDPIRPIDARIKKAARRSFNDAAVLGEEIEIQIALREQSAIQTIQGRKAHTTVKKLDPVGHGEGHAGPLSDHLGLAPRSKPARYPRRRRPKPPSTPAGGRARRPGGRPPRWRPLVRWPQAVMYRAVAAEMQRLGWLRLDVAGGSELAADFALRLDLTYALIEQ